LKVVYFPFQSLTSLKTVSEQLPIFFTQEKHFFHLSNEAIFQLSTSTYSNYTENKALARISCAFKEKWAQQSLLRITVKGVS